MRIFKYLAVRIAPLALLGLGLGGTASAATVQLTDPELADFVCVSATFADPDCGSNTAFSGWDNDLQGFYSANWRSTVTDTVILEQEYVLGAARGAAGDSFQIRVENNNGAPWYFSVSINNGAVTSGPLLITQGTAAVFSLLMNAALTQVSVFVGQDIPIGETDRGPEYRLTRVPEPGSLALLGMGLLGFGLTRRRAA